MSRSDDYCPSSCSCGCASADTAQYAVSLDGCQGHTAGSRSACGSQIWAELLPRGLVHPGSRFGFLSSLFQEAPLDPFLQPVWVSVKGSPALKFMFPLFGVGNPDKGTFCLLLHITWNYSCPWIYMNGKWSKSNFIFSTLWDIQYSFLRCSQTKSLLGAAVFVQLYSAQPEILITDVRYLLFLGVFSYLVCHESVSRTRQNFLR